MPVNIRPLHGRVLVKRLESDEEQVRGGIIVPDTAKEKPQEATRFSRSSPESATDPK